MAYTAVITKATGDSAPASDWNTYIRDNWTFFATHTHSGASGDGSAALAPNTVLFTDRSDEDAPASGKTILWTNSGKLHQRTNGGSAEEFSVAGHTHAIAQKQEFTDHSHEVIGSSPAGLAGGGYTDSPSYGATYTTKRTITMTPTSADSLMAASLTCSIENGSGNAGKKLAYMRLAIDSTQKFELTADLDGDLGSNINEYIGFADVFSQIDGGSTVYDQDFKSETVGHSSTGVSFLTVVDLELS